MSFYQSEKVEISNISFPRMGIESTTASFRVTVCVPAPRLALNSLYLYIILIKIEKKKTKNYKKANSSLINTALTLRFLHKNITHNLVQSSGNNYTLGWHLASCRCKSGWFHSDIPTLLYFYIFLFLFVWFCYSCLWLFVIFW